MEISFGNANGNNTAKEAGHKKWKNRQTLIKVSSSTSNYVSPLLNNMGYEGAF